MFAVNDIVVYNHTDVCRVEDIRAMPFPGEEHIEYYMLKPVYEETMNHSTLYVPVTAGEDRIRRAFTAQELMDMLAGPCGNFRWIDSAMIRKKEFNDVLGRNDPRELISMVRTVGAKRAEKLAAGQKFSDSDEKHLVLAQKRLFPLFRYTVHVEWEDFVRMLTQPEE